MSKSRPPVMLTAALCSAAVTAAFIAGKATRDSLLLTALDISSLPTMLVAAAACSLLLVAAQMRWAGKISPAVLVPAAFVVSGVLFLGEWHLRGSAPAAIAVIVYLHVSGAGPLLASGFWLIVSERFDPHTAKSHFGQIAAAGTLGGLLGALLSERVARLLGVPSMLLFLAGFQFLTAWLVRRLAASTPPAVQTISPSIRSTPSTPPLRASLQVIAAAPHLRHLMALVVLGTTSAALLEYLFKVRAVEAFGAGDGLLRFFALYYGITSLLTFIVQSLGSRVALNRFGLALTTSTPSIALLAGSIADLVAPGLGSVMVARGGESILRGSWFRAGYELFYAPISAAEKQAAKPVIDVALDRAGDAIGGGLVRLAVVSVPLATQSPAILCVAIVCSIGAIVAASHLNRWHLRTLENSLVRQAGHIPPSAASGGITARLLLSMQKRRSRDTQGTESTAIAPHAADPVVMDILALRSGRRERILRVLSRQEGIAGGLVPHVIPLLASESLRDYASFALRKVAEERVGELTDALLDPNQPYLVRSRLARVFSVCVSQRAADALMLALEDGRFEVRSHAAQSLAAILDKNPRIRVGRAQIEEFVRREVALGHPLTHIFTLLSLVLPKEPLQIAFRSLHAEDPRLRGTALDYLEEVLPARIRQELWPFLVQARPADAAATQREAIVGVPIAGFSGA